VQKLWLFLSSLVAALPNWALNRHRDEDFRKFNERAEEVEAMKARCEQMRLRLESYELNSMQVEDTVR
jgi:hypothetical protein